MDNRNFIAKNVARMFSDGDVVNLGVGIPTLASSYVPDDIQVFFHAENGAVGAGEAGGFPWDSTTRESHIEWLEEYGGEKGSWKTWHRDLCNASGEVIKLIPGAACCDSCMAFGIARGGHLDATVLGALQVDEECNLANWKIPGVKLNGMGGAMDIVSGAKRVIIAMEHCTKKGAPKIVEKCTLPLTAVGCVNTIVTEKCIIDCKPGRLTVVAKAKNVTREDIIANTGAKLYFADDVADMIE